MKFAISALLIVIVVSSPLPAQSGSTIFGTGITGKSGWVELQSSAASLKGFRP